MANPKAEDLVKLPFEERDKLYQYPYTGPYSGEPDLYEILHLKEYREIWGSNRLTILHTCPACNSPKAEWIRNEWAICFNCIIAFEWNERYYDPRLEDE